MVKQLVMGNEAFAHAALAAGVRVVAGYPGTPSSELIEAVAAERFAGRAKGVHVEWSTNEKAALELLAGASIAGARGLFTCKQMGLNVASDALLCLNYVGVKGGLVLFVADDPGPISSQTEQDTRRFAKFAKVPVLDPATIDQGYEMMLAAFELSERYETPVIVRSSTRVSHASTFLEIEEHTNAQETSGFKRDQRWVIFPKRSFEAHGEINERLRLIAQDFAREPYLRFNPIETVGAEGAASSGITGAPGAPGAGTPDAFGTDAPGIPGASPQIGILTGGVSASYVLEALARVRAACQESGTALPAYRFMQVGTPYPFPEEAFAPFAEGLEAILVFEELDHVLEDEALAFCGRNHAGFEVYGKLTGHTRDRGENTVDDVFERIAAFLGIAENFEKASAVGRVSPANVPFAASQPSPAGAPSAASTPSASTLSPTNQPSASLSAMPQLPVRPPVLCAGCPHRGGFYAVNQALKQMKATGIYCGDIGCYTLGNAEPLDAVDTCLCMGAGITMAQGFSIVEGEKKSLAFVGDSTFFASGITGIVNAAYNDHDITVVVLDNMVTAMTGAQPHPGTGVTLMGTQSEPISIEAVLHACGFSLVERANPFDLPGSIAAAMAAIGHKGPSAVIYQAPCITLVAPNPPAEIGEDCTGCKKCIKEIGCPAISFDSQARVSVINETLCTGCELCVQVCPFGVIERAASEEEAQAEGEAGTGSEGQRGRRGGQ